MRFAQWAVAAILSVSIVCESGGGPVQAQLPRAADTTAQLLGNCKLAAGEDSSEDSELDQVKACAMRLAADRRVPESIAMAERGLALALKQSGEQSEDYADALDTHAACIGLTGNVVLAQKELQRAEQILAGLQKQ